MRNETKCGRSNMALHLNELYKSQKGGLRAHLSKSRFWEKKRGEK